MTEKNIGTHVKNNARFENDFEHAHQAVENTTRNNEKEVAKKQINEIQQEEKKYNEFERQRKIAEQEAIARVRERELAMERERARKRERDEREREQHDRDQERYANAPTSKSLIEEIVDGNLISSNFSFFLLFAMGILVFVSFRATPDILRDSWNIFYPLSDGTKLINLNFSCTVFPAILTALINLYCFFKKKLMFCYKMNFFNHLISEALLGYTIYLANIVFTCIVEIFGGLNIIEGILGFVLLAILYFLSFSVYALPVAIIFTIIASVEKTENS